MQAIGRDRADAFDHFVDGEPIGAHDVVRTGALY